MSRRAGLALKLGTPAPKRPDRASRPPSRGRTRPVTVVALNSCSEARRWSRAKVKWEMSVEIVTAKTDATCDVLTQSQGVTFSEPITELGSARTAKLTDGDRIGVRAPERRRTARRAALCPRR